ncbi:MAG: zinc-ribbon domain-containing protein [Clostridia bacterium]|nr:zinc-ribbon domain-containing protein [Clostridia bacterium]
MKKIVLALTTFFVVLCIVACNKTTTVTCPSCQAQNSDDVKFCFNCGTSLQSIKENYTSGNQNNISGNGNIGAGENSENNNQENLNNKISNAKDFLNSIKSDSTITLYGGEINFENLSGISNSFVEKSDVDDGYIIKNIDNLIIVGNESTIKKTSLSFENCNNITINGLNFDNSVYGDEIYLYEFSFANCSNVNVSRCSFYNAECAIDLFECNKVFIDKNSFNSVFDAVFIWFSEANVTDCNFNNCNRVFGCCESVVNIKKCDMKEINDFYLITDFASGYMSDKIYNESNICIENCNLTNSKLLSFFAKQVKDAEQYIHGSLNFKNCKFSNNIYCYGEINTENYIDCTFDNNQKGVDFLWDFTGWEYDEVVMEELEASGLNVVVEYVYNDIETDCLYPVGTIVSQSECGILSKNSTVKLTVSKAAITIEEIDIEINSVGGVEPDITFINNTDKQIAYIRFTIKFYDRMGYPAYCKYEDTHTQNLKVTGPVNPGERDTIYWEPVMYHNATAVAQPIKTEVTFTDGTKQIITHTGRYWYTGSYYGGELH